MRKVKLVSTADSTVLINIENLLTFHKGGISCHGPSIFFGVHSEENYNTSLYLNIQYKWEIVEIDGKPRLIAFKNL